MIRVLAWIFFPPFSSLPVAGGGGGECHFYPKGQRDGFLFSPFFRSGVWLQTRESAPSPTPPRRDVALRSHKMGVEWVFRPPFTILSETSGSNLWFRFSVVRLLGTLATRSRVRAPLVEPKNGEKDTFQSVPLYPVYRNVGFAGWIYTPKKKKPRR